MEPSNPDTYSTFSRSRGALVAVLLAALAAGGGSALAFDVGVERTQVSPPPPLPGPGEPSVVVDPNDADSVALASNTRANEVLVVWDGAALGSGKREVLARLLDAEGQPIGPTIPISQTGSIDDPRGEANSPDVVYNSVANEYFVVWQADPGVEPMVDDELEIYGRRVSAAGAPLGEQVRISTMGTDGDARLGALDPAIAWSQTAGRYLVVWWGDDETDDLVDGELEIHGQILDEALQLVGARLRLSDMGPDREPTYDASRPDAAWNPARNEFMVVWQGDDDSPGLINNGEEIFGQRVSMSGEEIGADTRISHMGPDDSASFDAAGPAIAVNPGADEFLVVWSGDDDGEGLGDEQTEIFGQRVSGAGEEIGPDVRLSKAGPDGSADYGAKDPAITWQAGIDGYLLVWAASDDDPALAEGEVEIIGRSLASDLSGDGGAEVRISSHSGPGGVEFPAEAPAIAATGTDGSFIAAWHGLVAEAVGHSEVFAQTIKVPPVDPGRPKDPLPPACAPPLKIAAAGGKGKLTLSAGQLAINQRIGQAAVRRANAIQAWLDAGIVSSDICAGGIGPSDLDPGITLAAADESIGGRPAPRPLEIAPPGNGKGEVKLEAEQLLINQRIYQAAVRRSNALGKRLSNLTGGDLVDGALTADRLATNVKVAARTPAAAPTPASETTTAPRGGTAKAVKLDVEQLEINQKIAQAAVRRTNVLRVRISTGLTGDNFADGTITAVDLTAPSS